MLPRFYINLGGKIVSVVNFQAPTTSKYFVQVQMKKSNQDSVIHEEDRIELLIRIIDDRNIEFYIIGMLIDYFGPRNSPNKPVCVWYDSPWRPKNQSEVYVDFKNFRIVELIENPELHFDVLAKIAMQKYLSHVVVFIYKENDDPNSWAKVLSITKEIIAQMKVLKFDIESIKPPSLIAQGSIPAWEQIPDQNHDRTILRMWHEEHTYKEIGLYLNLSPETIGNRLSYLRGIHGTNIVPRDTQRKTRK